jgi:hypothetical protein
MRGFRGTQVKQVQASFPAIILCHENLKYCVYSCSEVEVILSAFWNTVHSLHGSNMTRPNEGRKRRGKQSQPANRLRLPFRSGRSKSGSYPSPQQSQPAENGITPAAGSSDGWAETQQVRGERTSRSCSQGLTRRSTPTWVIQKPWRGSRFNKDDPFRRRKMENPTIINISSNV